MVKRMIYKYYSRQDCILYLLTGLVLVLLDIVVVVSYLNLIFKVLFFLISFYFQCRFFIISIQYYTDRDNHIILSDDTLKIHTKKKNYEVAFNDIESMDIDSISRIIIKTNNEYIVFRMPIFLKDKTHEILNLIIKNSNIKDSKNYSLRILIYSITNVLILIIAVIVYYFADGSGNIQFIPVIIFEAITDLMYVCPIMEKPYYKKNTAFYKLSIVLYLSMLFSVSTVFCLILDITLYAPIVVISHCIFVLILIIHSFIEAKLKHLNKPDNK